MTNSKSPQSNCPIVEMANRPKVLFHIHYDGSYLGLVEARTTTEAFRKARTKFGRNIIKNDLLLEVVEE